MRSKTDFHDIFKLFWRYLDFVRALFLAIQVSLIGVFSAPTIKKRPRKIHIFIEIGPPLKILDEKVILTILEVKKVDFWTFSRLFWSCLESVLLLFMFP